ncbi:hypothetical protein HDV00_008442 [Rhizophlyctis rosea]|nr:hypothetical protein HDV00_008442 [Rhizophlyctis rosea]
MAEENLDVLETLTNPFQTESSVLSELRIYYLLCRIIFETQLSRGKRHLLLKALRSADSVGSNQLKSLVTNILGTFYIDTDPIQAAKLFKTAWKLSKKSKNDSLASVSAGILAGMTKQQGDEVAGRDWEEQCKSFREKAEQAREELLKWVNEWDPK